VFCSIRKHFILSVLKYIFEKHLKLKEMKLFYLSEARFIRKIVRRWRKNKVKFNAGNQNILRYSFRAVQYWSNLEGQKVSERNRLHIQNKLFEL
jgi:hypothetical protein